MFDFVANHTSSHSPWFLGWLAGDPAYDGFYVEQDPDFDESRVVRPRTTPLYHPFPRPDGTKAWAWTTFGEDQVDVDVRHPRTLLELTDVLLGYLARGASAVRLDAIGFLWKESGTTCLHLPQTHAVIKLWRALVDHVAPGHPAAHRDQRPARREHLLLRRRPRRGAPGLPVRAAAAGAALLRGRVHRPARRLGRRRRAGQRHRDLVQLPGQPRRHRDAGHRGDPRRRRARGAGRADPRPRRPGVVGQPAGRLADGSTSSTSATSTRCARSRRPGIRRSWRPRRSAAHSILFAFLGVPAVYYHSLRRVATRPRGDGHQPDQPPDQPRRPRRRPAGRRAARGPAAPAGLRRACGACSTYAGGTRRSRRSAPSGSSAWTTGSSRCAAARAPRDELLCVTNVSGDEVRAAGRPGVRHAHRHACRPAGAGAVAVGLGAPGLSQLVSEASWLRASIAATVPLNRLSSRPRPTVPSRAESSRPRRFLPSRTTTTSTSVVPSGRWVSV